VLEERWKVSEVAAAFEISERTVYRWLARWRAGDRELRDRSSAPRRIPRRTPRAVEALIEQLRRAGGADTLEGGIWPTDEAGSLLQPVNLGTTAIVVVGTVVVVVGTVVVVVVTTSGSTPPNRTAGTKPGQHGVSRRKVLLPPEPPSQ
jgi:leucine-zipper of insertion element IS481